MFGSWLVGEYKRVVLGIGPRLLAIGMLLTTGVCPVLLFRGATVAVVADVPHGWLLGRAFFRSVNGRPGEKDSRR
jgi:hypothetical protein